MVSEEYLICDGKTQDRTTWMHEAQIFRSVDEGMRHNEYAAIRRVWRLSSRWESKKWLPRGHWGLLVIQP